MATKLRFLRGFVVDLAIVVPRNFFNTALNARRCLSDHRQPLTALWDDLRHIDGRKRIADMVIEVSNLLEPSMQASLKEEPNQNRKQNSLDDVYQYVFRKK
jgi:hypothetical protein